MIVDYSRDERVVVEELGREEHEGIDWDETDMELE